MKRLTNSLKKYNNAHPVRFHVPSHKGRLSQSLLDAADDITELDFSDNLNHPHFVIADEEKKAAEIFGVKHTLFTTNGATSAVIASILYAIKSNEKILIPTDSHISAYYGAVHADAQIVRCVVKQPLSGITMHELAECIELNPDISVCLITNPTYYGFCCDIRSVCTFLKSKNILCIVDESHGTHLHFSDAYPLSAIDSDADIVIHSGHKTINGLTQTGMIQINSDQIDVEHLRTKLRLLSSTSPSYLLLQSLTEAVRQLKNIENVLYNLKLWYNKTVDALEKSDLFSVMNHAGSGITAFDCDPMRLCIGVADGNGREYAEAMQQDAALYTELSEDHLILCVAGLSSNWDDFVVLQNALMSQRPKTPIPIIKNSNYKNIIFPQQATSIKMAIGSDYEYSEINECIGEISADFISVYPPGAPFVLPGSMLDETVLNFIRSVPRECLVGLYGEKIKIVKRKI